MPDDLTPQEKRELDAIDRALAGRPVDPELEEVAALAKELHEMRAAPSAEYARELDEHAAGWLASSEPRRGRLAWLRVALPAAAAAAAAVVIAITITGGENGDESRLQLSVVQDDSPGALPLPAPMAESDGAESEGAHREEGAHRKDDAHQGPLVGKELELERRRVAAGQPIVVRFEVFSSTKATVQLGNHEGEIALEPGRGRLEIGTGALAPGKHGLSIILQRGGSLHTTVTVGG